MSPGSINPSPNGQTADPGVAETAHDGLPALERVRSWRSAIMLLDVGLSPMDGYGVARRCETRRDGQTYSSWL